MSTFLVPFGTSLAFIPSWIQGPKGTERILLECCLMKETAQGTDADQLIFLLKLDLDETLFSCWGDFFKQQSKIEPEAKGSMFTIFFFFFFWFGTSSVSFSWVRNDAGVQSWEERCA